MASSGKSDLGQELILDTASLLTWKNMTKLAIIYMNYDKTQLEIIMENKSRGSDYNTEVIKLWRNEKSNPNTTKQVTVVLFSV